VIIPGDMGTCSYVWSASRRHDRHLRQRLPRAGRKMSAARPSARPRRSIYQELLDRGVFAGPPPPSLDEEQPEAYKDVTNVVEVVHQAGLAKKVCRLRPLA